MMTLCREVSDAIEELAADEMAASSEVREHLTTCVACAASLALARRIHAALGPKAPSPAPARFTAAVMGRVRRERWRTEQRVDRVFNLAIAAAGLLLVAGIVMLLNRSGMVALAGDFGGALAEGTRAITARVLPSLPTYLAGSLLFVTAVGVWWWAERTG